MLKTITKSAGFSSLVLGLVSITNQVALAASKCTLNGQEVDCAVLAEKAKGFVGLGIGFFAVVFIVGILATIFWVMMIIHAAKHNIESKAVWIILMVFTGFIGAVIYYFAVKREFDAQAKPTSSMTPPVPPSSSVPPTYTPPSQTPPVAPNM